MGSCNHIFFSCITYKKKEETKKTKNGRSPRTPPHPSCLHHHLGHNPRNQRFQLIPILERQPNQRPSSLYPRRLFIFINNFTTIIRRAQLTPIDASIHMPHVRWFSRIFLHFASRWLGVYYFDLGQCSFTCG